MFRNITYLFTFIQNVGLPFSSSDFPLSTTLSMPSQPLRYSGIGYTCSLEATVESLSGGEGVLVVGLPVVKHLFHISHWPLLLFLPFPCTDFLPWGILHLSLPHFICFSVIFCFATVNPKTTHLTTYLRSRGTHLTGSLLTTLIKDVKKMPLDVFFFYLSDTLKVECFLAAMTAYQLDLPHHVIMYCVI